MDRIFFTIGAWLGALGVTAGAFGAHFLQGSLATPFLEILPIVLLQRHTQLLPVPALPRRPLL